MVKNKMTFSKALLGTAKETTRLNWFEYWFGHCYLTGWQSIRTNFRIWSDLMTNNFEGYALLREDDPFLECLDWFWASLNEDDVYPKEFLEYLMELADDAKKHPEKLVSYETVEEMFKDLHD